MPGAKTRQAYNRQVDLLNKKIATAVAAKLKLNGNLNHDTLVLLETACALLHGAADTAIDAAASEGQKYRFNTVALMLTTEAYSRIVKAERALKKTPKKKTPKRAP